MGRLQQELMTVEAELRVPVASVQVVRFQFAEPVAGRGSSIGNRVAVSRLDHAKRLLTGDQSVKAVAYALGFSSPSSFSYAFRQIAGETPRQIRQRALSGGRAAY
jgi:hypothetical protein